MDSVMRYLMQNPGALRFRGGAGGRSDPSDSEPETNEEMVTRLQKSGTLKL